MEHRSMAPRRSKRLGNKKAPVSSSPKKSPSKSTTLGRNKGTKKNKTRKSVRKSSSRKSITPVTNFPEVIDIVDAQPISFLPQSQNRRPQVINLDVTFSESSSESDVEEISTPLPKRRNNASMERVTRKPDLDSHKNIKNGRCSVSDSDEDFIPDFNPTGNDEIDSPSIVKTSFNYDSDSDFDIYKVNYKEEREKAFEKATKEFQRMDEKYKKKKDEKISLALLDSSNLSETSDNYNWGIDRSNHDSLYSSLEDSTNTPNVSLASVNNSKYGRSSIVRTSKKTKMAIQSLEAFSKKYDDMEKEEELDDLFCDDIMMEDAKVSIRICWGVTYTRHTLKKNAKLIGLYQELAEKHNASINEVLLSFKDKILSPETRPSDLKLSISDTLDGAIIRTSLKSGNDSECTKAEGSLSFKIQTSNRKVVHTVSINKYDKMSILMEKYSKLRNIPLDKLRFKFDGEALQSSDTPSSLDLEGDECIDVFEL
ncbi:UNVERIFIED_CONTAM: hypothetical protein RMT77_006705 [Armadillidium vulgare]